MANDGDPSTVLFHAELERRGLTAQLAQAAESIWKLLPTADRETVGRLAMEQIRGEDPTFDDKVRDCLIDATVNAVIGQDIASGKIVVDARHLAAACAEDAVVAYMTALKTVDLSRIPYEMRQAARWGLWRSEEREGKPTKVPYSVVTGGLASSTNLADWTSFDLVAAYFLRKRKKYGLGFVLGDGYAGVDLDKCHNPETGELTPWAAKVVADFASYTEVSPSGTGLKIFVRGSLPEGMSGRRKGKLPAYDGSNEGVLEAYSAGRYFTVTGVRYGG